LSLAQQTPSPVVTLFGEHEMSVPPPLGAQKQPVLELPVQFTVTPASPVVEVELHARITANKGTARMYLLIVYLHLPTRTL
jgi:hypothetical protein